VRIAILSPYSWTYPGGVTRHIDALASELRSSGHDTRILAPFDPDDALSRRLHHGARPQPCEVPEGFVSLGRTVGIQANGAVSNTALTPSSVLALREELRGGDFDVLHIHEPVVPLLSWDALFSAGSLPLVGTFHTYSENLLTNGFAAGPLGGRRRMNRLHARIAVSDAAAWTARRFYGGRYRIVPNGVHLRPLPAPAGPRRGGDPLRILFIGQAVQRKGLPTLLRAFEALREEIPATLTLAGAGPQEVAHMMLDGRGVEALGKVSDERKLAELAAADVLCAPSLHGESFGMVLTEAFAAATPVVASDIPGYRDVVRDGLDGLLVPAGDALALAESLRRLALDEPARAAMAGAARERAERSARRRDGCTPSQSTVGSLRPTCCREFRPSASRACRATCRGLRRRRMGGRPALCARAPWPSRARWPSPWPSSPSPRSASIGWPPACSHPSRAWSPPASA
jgi:phosphatidylinositol alpha-mannosyltransferase